MALLEDAAGLLLAPSLLTTLLCLTTSRLEARASLVDLAAADLEAAAFAGWVAAAAAAAAAAAPTSRAFFSVPSDFPLRPCGLTEEPVAVPLPVFSLSVPLPRAVCVDPAAGLPPCALDRADAAALLLSLAATDRREAARSAAGALPAPFAPIDPSGDLLRSGMGVEARARPGPGAGALDTFAVGAAAAAATLLSTGDRKAVPSVTVAALLPLLAALAETVCTGDDPSGFIAAAAVSDEILRRASPSGRGRGGEEIAPRAPANRMGGRLFPAVAELVDEGVREAVARMGDGAAGDATLFPKGVGGAAVAAVGEVRLAAVFLAVADAVVGVVSETAGAAVVVAVVAIGETRSKTVGEAGVEVVAAGMVEGVLVRSLATASMLAGEGDEMPMTVVVAAVRVLGPVSEVAGVMPVVEGASLSSALMSRHTTAEVAGVSLRGTSSVCSVAADGILETAGAVAPTEFSLGSSGSAAPAAVATPADTRVSDKPKQVSSCAPGVPTRLLRPGDPSPNDGISDTGVRTGPPSPRESRASRPAPREVDAPEESDVSGDDGVPRLVSAALSWAARWSRWRRRSLFSVSVSWRTSACFCASHTNVRVNRDSVRGWLCLLECIFIL